MEDHLNTSTYSLLKKNPTDSLSRKLDNVLKKLLKEGKISKTFHDNSRVLHPRAPQLYGLPKIHKPGNPLRPIVSFYDTPLSALHKQLSEVLKPLTLSELRLKNTEDFLTKFRAQLLILLLAGRQISLYHLRYAQSSRHRHGPPLSKSQHTSS